MDLLKKVKELEKLNDEIYQYSHLNNINDIFWNTTYIDEHIRDLKQSIIEYNKK